MVDTLAPRSIIGVMTPAMNTVIQPELELLRPPGVTNQMQRFRLSGERISDDLLAEAEKLLDCRPAALAVGEEQPARSGAGYSVNSCCYTNSASRFIRGALSSFWGCQIPRKPRRTVSGRRERS